MVVNYVSVEIKLNTFSLVNVLSVSCQNAEELEKENDYLKQQVAMVAAELQVHRVKHFLDIVMKSRVRCANKKQCLSVKLSSFTP